MTPPPASPAPEPPMSPIDPPRTVGAMTLSLPTDLRGAFDACVEAWRREGKVERLWARDATLWTGGDEARWLGWLDAADPSRRETLLRDAEALREDVRREGFDHVALVGMGGSSLCPEVLARTFGRRAGHPGLLVLDSTDPAEVLRLGEAIAPDRTLVIVASKSGTTLEPEVLRAHLFDRAAARLGRREAGRRFLAITDPGSALAARARQDGWRAVFDGVPSIGGRYSALSVFGMIPAAAIGLDVRALLASAGRMTARSAAGVPVGQNEAVICGCLIGTAARCGRDKLTLVASPRLRPLGAWLEQLVAESTGKQGRGVIPINGEEVAAPERYGEDRCFVHIRDLADPDRAQDEAVGVLAAAGHPVMRIDVEDPAGLGGEFLRWEIATAVAGSILRIHPFDQPDVEASKVAARRLTEAYEVTGALPAEDPVIDGEGLRVFADAGNLEAIGAGGGRGSDLSRLIGAHLGRLATADCFHLLAWIERIPDHVARLEAIRHAVRDRARVATTLGFGPRYLHSTGQIHKGGPPSGLFLMITCQDARDVPVPGRVATFGAIRAAQARGDLDVLAARGRRIVRIDLGRDAARGLEVLADRIRSALA